MSLVEVLHFSGEEFNVCSADSHAFDVDNCLPDVCRGRGHVLNFGVLGSVQYEGSHSGLPGCQHGLALRAEALDAEFHYITGL